MLIPLSGLFLKTATITWAHFWQTVSVPARAMASYRLTFGAAFLGASRSMRFSVFVVAWSLVRYRFPGRRILNTWWTYRSRFPPLFLVIALTALYSKNGWIGQMARATRHQGGLLAVRSHPDCADLHWPAVRCVRTLQPAIQDLDAGMEEGGSRSETQGASRLSGT